MEQKMDEESRDYKVEDLEQEEDSRFRCAAKEMKRIHISYFLFILVEFTTAYGVFHFYPEKGFCGFPLWFAAGVFVCLLYWAVVTRYLLHGISDCSLSAREGENRNE